MTAHAGDKVFVITTEDSDDLLVGFGITQGELGSIASLVLQRSPRFEHLLPPDQRGVAVSYELDPSEDRQVLQSVSVNGTDVSIVTDSRAYRLDVSGVETDEAEEALAVLKRMYEYGGFVLRLR